METQPQANTGTSRVVKLGNMEKKEYLKAMVTSHKNFKWKLNSSPNLGQQLGVREVGTAVLRVAFSFLSLK